MTTCKKKKSTLKREIAAGDKTWMVFSAGPGIQDWLSQEKEL